MITILKGSELPKLSTAQRIRFAELRRLIMGRLVDAQVEVGAALKEIRDEKLYREDYDSFGAFCRDVFEMSRSQAYRLIDAVKVNENLSTVVDKPLNECAARELKKVTPEKQREIVADLRRDGEVTSKRIKAIVEPKQKRCPTCGRLL